MKTKILLMTVVVSLGFATIAMAQNSASYIPDNGLGSCYSFTGDAIDHSAGTNNGVIDGATLVAGKEGLSNTAYSFDGISNTVNFSSPFLGGTQVSAFTYHVRLNVNDVSNSPNIWGKTLYWGEVNFQLTSEGAVSFWWANNITGNKYSSIKSDNNIISESTWYDIVVVYQNSGAEIYVNGQSVTANLEWAAQGGSVLSTTQIEASCNFAQEDNSSKIGVRITGGSLGNYFNGIIDEFCIWDSALTQEEINEIYNSSAYIPDNGLGSCYSFTGDAIDHSAGTNNGVIDGATLVAGKEGLSNTAYSFDGISNTVNFSSPFLGGTQVSAFTYHVRLNVNDVSNSPNIWGKTLYWGEVNFQLTSEGAVSFWWANNITGNKYSSIKSDNNIISESTWYDIVVVYQNSGAEIYVNGQSVTANLEWAAQGGSVLSTTQIEASCNFAQEDNSSKIGVRITGGSLGNYFNGIIDEFCIWDSALTQEEINEIYNSSAYTPITDANIQTAVDLWVSDPSAATTTYGAISTWDVSQLTNMSELFRDKTNFNDDISSWDVSSVTHMQGMFYNATAFNQDIGAWDVISVTDMGVMFIQATSFNQPLNSWNVSSVTNMEAMFFQATSFNQPLNSWNVSSVTDMEAMFYGAPLFNQPLNSWNVSSVTNMEAMFFQATSFNQPLNSWNVSSVTKMQYMFNSASSFNQDIGAWNVSSVTNMRYMFYGAWAFNQDISSWCVTNISSESSAFSFDSPLTQSNKPVWGTCPSNLTPITDANIQTAVDLWVSNPAAATTTYGNISDWDVSQVTNMSELFFQKTTFNDDISSWDVSNVTNMYALLWQATSFNQDISGWDLSNVTNMRYMFYDASAFNQDISSWDVSSVNTMERMFYGASSFNQDIGTWDVSSVTDMSWMFFEASAFNQDITGWCVTNIVSEPTLFSLNSPLSESNKPVWGYLSKHPNPNYRC